MSPKLTFFLTSQAHNILVKVCFSGHYPTIMTGTLRLKATTSSMYSALESVLVWGKTELDKEKNKLGSNY